MLMSRSDCRGERSCSKVQSQRASCSFVVLGAFAAGSEGCYSLIGITWTFLRPKELPVLRPVTLGSRPVLRSISFYLRPVVILRSDFICHVQSNVTRFPATTTQLSTHHLTNHFPPLHTFNFSNRPLKDQLAITVPLS